MRSARPGAVGDDRDARSATPGGAVLPGGAQGPEEAVDGERRRLGLPSKAAGWGFLLLVVAAVIAANALLSHSSTKTRPHEVGSDPPSQPDPRQAASVAQREFGLLSGGGWAQAWQLWSDAARSTLSQAEFVRLNAACPPALGVPYIIDATTLTDATTVEVTWHQSSSAGTATVVYENGAWRFTPDAQTLTDYRRKAAGQCR